MVTSCDMPFSCCTLRHLIIINSHRRYRVERSHLDGEYENVRVCLVRK